MPDNMDRFGPNSLGPRRNQATPGNHRHLVGTPTEGYISEPLFQGEAPTSILDLIELLEDYGLDGSQFTVSVEYITRWRFDSATGMADPGSGEVRMNGTVSPTALAFSRTTHLGGDATNYMRKLAAGDQIFLQKIDDAGRFYRYQVSGAVTDNTSWFQVPVTLMSKGGTIWGNNDVLGVALIYITTGGGGGGGGVSDHGALTGLTDDDHPQYLKPTEVVAGTSIAITQDDPVSGSITISADAPGVGVLDRVTYRLDRSASPVTLTSGSLYFGLLSLTGWTLLYDERVSNWSFLDTGIGELQLSESGYYVIDIELLLQDGADGDAIWYSSGFSDTANPGTTDRYAGFLTAAENNAAGAGWPIHWYDEAYVHMPYNNPETWGVTLKAYHPGANDIKIKACHITITRVTQGDDALSSGAATWTRTSSTITTLSLINGETDEFVEAFAPGYRLLTLEVDRACRVRLYKSSAARAADASRPIGTDVDIATDHGLVFEYVADAAIAVMLSPLVDGYCPAGVDVYYSIQNRSGATSTVEVTFDWLRTE